MNADKGGVNIKRVFNNIFGSYVIILGTFKVFSLDSLVCNFLSSFSLSSIKG